MTRVIAAPPLRARLKQSVRARVSTGMWDGAAKLAGRLSTSTATVLGFGVKAVSAALPDSVLLAMLRHLEMLRPMDYRPATIWLRVSSPTELRLRLRSCEKEPETVAWIEDSLQGGSVLYDVGANVGAYSLVAAKAVPEARVYAFEPGLRTYQSLVENIEINGESGRITPLQVALSDHTGIASFEYASSDAGEARHPGVLTGEGPRGPVQAVLGYRLDDLIATFGLPHPTHVKIDVDGAEVHVLRGAVGVLRSPSVRQLLVETRPEGETGREVTTLLGELGFHLEKTISRGPTDANCFFVRY